ncbi:MAG: hypothetical protein VB862_02840 [Pirellulaceae bacterium]
MKQIAKVSLFLLHLTGVLLCLSCTVVTIDRVVTLIPRYTSLGGWLSHLEADSTHVLWLTTWSLGLAAVPAMGLFCLDKPVTPRRQRRRPIRTRQTGARQTGARQTGARQTGPPVSWQRDQDELVISWIDDGLPADELMLAGASSSMVN